nr:hypothetical protein [Tanacetum cinerariifolium]
MSTQQDINAIRVQRLANIHDPLALMANTQTPFHPDHSSLITYIQHPQPNNNFVLQPSFNTNYLQHPMQNLKDISNPTTALDMALKLMTKAFQLNNTTPTNNNQRSSSNPCYSQIAQSGVGNQNGLSVDPGIENQHGNGNVVAARAKGNSNGINGNLIRDRCILLKKEEAGIQLTSEKFDLMAAASAAYGSSMVHLSENCYDNDIFNMFTQEEQYTELLKPIPVPHQVQQNDSNVIFAVSSMEHSGRIVEQHFKTVEETHAYHVSLFHNLAAEVEKVNSVNHKLRETNADLTTELARYKNQEKCFEISQEEYDKLERCYQKSVYQEQCLTKTINALHLSSVVSHDIMSIAQNNSVVDSSNYQTELERTKERFENYTIKKENEYAKLWNDWYKNCEECKYDKISYDKAYNDMQQTIKRLQAQLGDLKATSKDTPGVSYTLDPLSYKIDNENLELEFQV